jgi:peptidoglycan/xylan/chitin deacetylase (PgdA/CDA1 family)
MLKQSLHTLIRKFHLSFAMKALPERVAVYFHHLEPEVHDKFRDFVQFFRAQDYSFVSANSYSRPQSKQLFISFDDNYRSWHRSLKLLNELDIRVTFYTNTLPFRDTATPQIINDYYLRIAHDSEKISLSRQELKEIGDAGHTIACHTHSHFNLRDLSFEDAVEEMLINKALLEKITEQSVDHFSFPFGMRRNFSEKLRAWCLSNGFKTICNAIPGMQHCPFDPANIYRTNWRFNLSLEENIDILKVDGRLFERLTGKSAVA